MARETRKTREPDDVSVGVFVGRFSVFGVFGGLFLLKGCVPSLGSRRRESRRVRRPPTRPTAVGFSEA